jgi:outer membrane immunogenic protein
MRRSLLLAMLPFSLMITGASADNFEPVPQEGRWSGVYVGLHAGYGWNDTAGAYDFGDFNDVLFEDVGLSSSLDDKLEGYIVGGQLGLQRQFGNIVLGIEGTLSATDMDGSSSAEWGFNAIECFGLCFGAAAEGTQSLEVEIDNLFTVTGKLGFAYEDWLFYAKGGYASADIGVTSSIVGDGIGCFFACVFPFDVSAVGSSEKRHDGYVIGGGLERMIHPNLTVGVEYSYVDLGSRTHSIDAPLNISDVVEIEGGHKVRVDPDEIHTVSLRMNFLLNGPEHVEAAPLK